MAKNTYPSNWTKCAKCSQKFAPTQAGNKAYQKHYALKHFKPKKKAKSSMTRKIPGFAHRRK